MGLKTNTTTHYILNGDGEVVGYVHLRKDENGFLRIVGSKLINNATVCDDIADTPSTIQLTINLQESF